MTKIELTSKLMAVPDDAEIMISVTFLGEEGGEQSLLMPIDQLRKTGNTHYLVADGLDAGIYFEEGRP